MDDVPVEAWLLAWPAAIRALALDLRSAVVTAEPSLRERIRHGWRLVGYDVPVAGRLRYLGGIGPEHEHVHLYLEVGWLMRPRPELEGAHLGLRRVRFLTYRPGDAVAADLVAEVVREAVSIVRLPAGERRLLAEARQPG